MKRGPVCAKRWQKGVDALKAPQLSTQLEGAKLDSDLMNKVCANGFYA